MRFLIFILIILVWVSDCMLPTQELATMNIGPGTVTVPLDTYQEIRYVSKVTGSDSKGTGTLEQPWQSIPFALTEISDAGSDNRYAVLVASGDYSCTPIELKPHVDLYGGFEPMNWQRDLQKYRTVLTGGDERRVVIGADFACLDGFVIRNGQIRGKGAGLLCHGTSPVITNNVFSDNKTLAPVCWQPKYLHEIANDGGAIYCANGSAPIIENNIFVNNLTEIGRGAAIAFHSKCNGRIMNNVFMENITGGSDPMRSSDGGAISIFDWSSPVIENNIILNNKALAENDAGGVFVALWSAPIIRKNIFVGNEGTDDAGALFVGGQEHRYDVPLDTLPPEDKFFVRIASNIFVGNSNPSKNSGAMRFTMESRGDFSDNIVVHNSGIYFQRSEVTIERNVILDDFLFIETKEGLKPGVIRHNVIWGNFVLTTAAIVKDNYLKIHYDDNFSTLPDFVDDWIEIKAMAATYRPKQCVTGVLISNGRFNKNELAHRLVKAGSRWGVIKSNDRNEIEIWGDFSQVVQLLILPTYRMK